MLATLLSNGQPYSFAWPASDIVICEQARTKKRFPVRSKRPRQAIRMITTFSL